jgi:hypothetical protein
MHLAQLVGVRSLEEKEGEKTIGEGQKRRRETSEEVG